MKWKSMASAFVATSLLVGCGSSSSGTDNSTDSGKDAYKSVVIDAGSYDDYAYFSFAEEKTVTASDDWDLAFKRTELIMNGGDTGDKGVKMALADTPDGFYDSEGNAIEAQFKAALPQNYLEAFLAAGADDNETAYGSDELTLAINGMVDGDTIGWYYYCGLNSEECSEAETAAHKIVANEDAWYLLRSGGQIDDAYSYAKFRVTDIVYQSSGNERNVTIEVYPRTSGSTYEATPKTAVLAAEPDSEACYRIHDDEVTDCSGEWDIKHWRNGTKSALRINTGPSGSGDGRVAVLGEDNSTLASGTDIATRNPDEFPNPFWSLDKMASDYGKYNALYGWGWYQSGKLYPNYRTYLLDNGEGGKYAVQYAGYYHPDSEESAHVTLRYRKVQ